MPRARVGHWTCRSATTYARRLHAGQTVHLDEGRVAFTVNLRNSKGEENEERDANLFAAFVDAGQFLRESLVGVELDLLEHDQFLSCLATKLTAFSEVAVSIFRIVCVVGRAEKVHHLPQIRSYRRIPVYGPFSHT